VKVAVFDLCDEVVAPTSAQFGFWTGNDTFGDKITPQRIESFIVLVSTFS
jgi:hypothetical protein